MFEVVGFDRKRKRHLLLDGAGKVAILSISDYYHFFLLPEGFVHVGTGGEFHRSTRRSTRITSRWCGITPC